MQHLISQPHIVDLFNLLTKASAFVGGVDPEPLGQVMKNLRAELLKKLDENAMSIMSLPGAWVDQESDVQKEVAA